MGSLSSRHVDTNSKNVFGQPRLRASLRDLRSPRRTYKSTIEDDLKKLIIMDSPGDTPQRDPVRRPSDHPHVSRLAAMNPSHPLLCFSLLDDRCSAPSLMSRCAAGAERPASPTATTLEPPMMFSSRPRCPPADMPSPIRSKPKRVSSAAWLPPSASSFKPCRCFPHRSSSALSASLSLGAVPHGGPRQSLPTEEAGSRPDAPPGHGRRAGVVQPGQRRQSLRR